MACTLGGALNVWFGINIYVRQLLLHFLISGGASKTGKDSQRRLRSHLIIYTIFESSLARVSCFLVLLWVLKDTVGLFAKCLESRGISQ